MKMNIASLQNRIQWEQAGVTLPDFHWNAMCAATEKTPSWVRFGAGRAALEELV